MVKVHSTQMKIKFLTIILFFLSTTINYAESYIKASEGITWDKNNQTYSAQGNVEFKNNEIKAYANKIFALYSLEDDKEIFQKVNLDGSVIIHYQGEVFNANSAIYDKVSNLITLFEKVTIISPERYLSGDELIVDLKNNTRTLKTIGKDSIAEALIKNE